MFLLLICSAQLVSSQEDYVVQLIDGLTDEPIADANVFYQDSTYQSSAKGLIEIKAKLRDTARISHFAYRPLQFVFPEHKSVIVKVDLCEKFLNYEHGYDALMAFFSRISPLKLVENTRKGVVFVTFEIDDKGELAQVEAKGTKGMKIMETEMKRVILMC